MPNPKLTPEIKEKGEKVLAELEKMKMPFSAEWKYQSSLGQYHLIIDSPWSVEKGEEATLQAIEDAISRAGIIARRSFVILKRH